MLTNIYRSMKIKLHFSVLFVIKHKTTIYNETNYSQNARTVLATYVATHYTLFSAFDLAAVFAGIILWTSFHWLAMCRRGGEDCFLGGIGFVLFLSLHIAFSFYRA